MIEKIKQKSIFSFLLVGLIIGWILGAYVFTDQKAIVLYSLSFLFSDQGDTTGYVIAQGSWDLVGEKIVNKYNSAEVQCYGPYTYMSTEQALRFGVDKYENAVCEILQADVFSGLLAVNKTTYSVSEWNDSRIISTIDGACATTTMIVDRKAETVTQTTSYTSENIELCPPKGSKPKQVVLK